MHLVIGKALWLISVIVLFGRLLQKDQCEVKSTVYVPHTDCEWRREHAETHHTVWRSEFNSLGSVLFPNLWILEIELRSSCLGTSPLIPLDISVAQVVSFFSHDTMLLYSCFKAFVISKFIAQKFVWIVFHVY